jgi:hypothetical protein
MPKFAAVVATPDLKLYNPYFLISETNGRNATMNNSLIRFSKWHCRVAIQFEYCFPISGLCIDIYEYGMLSMGFD